jgi:hypothetical protein
MSWPIHIPYRDRSAPLTDVVDAARGLSTDDAAIARQIVLGEITRGSAATIGELLDKLEKATPQERRKVLDTVRSGAGLKTTEQIDFEVRHEQVQRNARARPSWSRGTATSVLGVVRHGLEQVTSRDDARRRMLIILCGLIEGADDWDDIPEWPLRTNASSNELNLQAMAEYLGLDRESYDALRFEALRLTLDREYQLLFGAITGMLAYHPRIGPELIARLQRLARGG